MLYYCKATFHTDDIQLKVRKTKTMYKSIVHHLVADIVK